ncbi:MAG TPA: GFA family protein [Caulobacteraceae bacterium]|nr:GFA family protein [Caulobacteraceae bacterium]
MKVDGRCHCGFVTFEAEAEPVRTSMCCCTDCQALTGQPFRVTIAAEPGSFRLLSGEPSLYVKTADSGTRRQHAFCPRCGSPVYATGLGDEPKPYSLRWGTLAQREHFAPTRQIWTRSRAEWVTHIAELPAAAMQS